MSIITELVKWNQERSSKLFSATYQIKQQAWLHETLPQKPEKSRK